MNVTRQSLNIVDIGQSISTAIIVFTTLGMAIPLRGCPCAPFKGIYIIVNGNRGDRVHHNYYEQVSNLTPQIVGL